MLLFLSLSLTLILFACEQKSPSNQFDEPNQVFIHKEDKSHNTPVDSILNNEPQSEPIQSQELKFN